MQVPDFFRVQDVEGETSTKISWSRVLGAGLLATTALAGAAYFVVGDSKPDEVKQVAAPTNDASWNSGVTWTPPPAETEEASLPVDEENEQVADAGEATQEDNSEAEARARAKREKWLAMAEGEIKTYTMDHGKLEQFAKAEAQFGGGGRGCAALPGQFLMAQLVSYVNTANGGTVVARVRENVTDVNGETVIATGDTLTGTVGGTAHGQKRANIAFHTLTTTDGKVIKLGDSIAGDSMGTGGVPGHVDSKEWPKFQRVIVATAVDLSGLFIGSRNGSMFGVIGGNAGGAAQDWARQALDVKPEITVSPMDNGGNYLTIPITEPINLC